MGKPKSKSVPVRMQRVLDEAEELFTREGFLHFSTDELARRLRCSKRTIYAVAPGREKFLEAVILHRVTKAEDATIAPLRNAATVQAAVQGFISVSVEQAQESTPLFMRDVMLFPAGRRAVRTNGAPMSPTNWSTSSNEGSAKGCFERLTPASPPRRC